ncbi:MAG TPA: hypothetical protein VHV28_15640 [Solirubrobacteraceae bacterium]|jgi:hypothetical protein|nr:hypothetical protein [Solirubrobacteraceae bacterium]
MKWLAATLALLAASAALVGGIFLRDRSSSWRLPPRQAAQVDALKVLNFIAGPGCGSRCSYRVVSHPRPDHWLALIVDRSRPHCVDINVQTFAISPQNGMSGMQRIGCDGVPGAPGS